MTPAEVGTAAVEHGLAVTWRFEFDIGEVHGTNGYSECWCVALLDCVLRRSSMTAPAP